ncbi:hypothetical protein [Pseudodesulfovibrio sp. zrk46]|uniref:hypothetical protein n=1 Tax=Pseudodesulfovibrio sp. zrk46 TaxID=2725288 RepID=UPI001449EBEE|nr:hypothetical protein [Pseudodesulfovibrio sp. zrk46]QJB57763.1 hypothetical protein HFN16_15725 [Pseudodesulfovibrio sp. zrk46]
MTDFRDIADQLQQEVVTDMAETYFGTRRELDDKIRGFELMVDEFRGLVPRLSQAAARLNLLLLDAPTARDFYIALDIVPSCIPVPSEYVRPFFDKLPWAFTGGGRYARCVCRAYDLLQKAADDYLNGHYYPDPDVPGRKRLTVHYLRLRALAEHINDEVERVNTELSPSSTLRYVKRMDTEQSEREDVIGLACLTDGCGLDNDLKFDGIDFNGLNLPVVQDLPRISSVKEAIKDFCKEIYPARKQDITIAMNALREE